MCVCVCVCVCVCRCAGGDTWFGSDNSNNWDMVIIKILCDHRTVSLDQVTVMSLINHCCISHSRLQVVWLQVQDLSFYYPITANANVIFLLIIAGGLMVGIVLGTS